MSSPAAVSRSGVVRDELPRHGREGIAASAFPRLLDLRLGNVYALGALTQQLIGKNAGCSQREWSAEGWIALVAGRQVERAERHLALPAVRPSTTDDPRLVPAGLDHKVEAGGSAVADFSALMGVRSQPLDGGIGQQLRQSVPSPPGVNRG